MVIDNLYEFFEITQYALTNGVLYLYKHTPTHINNSLFLSKLQFFRIKFEVF